VRKKQLGCSWLFGLVAHEHLSKCFVLFVNLNSPALCTQRIRFPGRCSSRRRRRLQFTTSLF
jgi:hypothetical protein